MLKFATLAALLAFAASAFAQDEAAATAAVEAWPEALVAGHHEGPLGRLHDVDPVAFLEVVHTAPVQGEQSTS